jgi:copper oxidase (laccase) domain-containing protein
MSLIPSKSFQPNQSEDPRSPKIFLFGRPIDWRGEETTLQMATFLQNRHVKRLFCPNPSKMNGHVATRDEFVIHTRSPLKFYNSALADAVVLEKPGEACLIKSADCPTIVVWNPEADWKRRKVVVAHGARNSLVDMMHVRGFSQGEREHKSVITPVIGQFDKSERPKLMVYIALGIGAQYFDHPFDHDTYGFQNEVMIKHILEKFGPMCVEKPIKKGMLNLRALIRAQCMQEGVLSANIIADRHDTFSERRQMWSRTSQWWSHKRGDSGRNAVLVVHTGEDRRKK